MEMLVKIPFAELLGLKLVRFETDIAEISLDLRPELCNSWSVAHGGVTMTLLDVVMAHAARSPRADGSVDSTGVVTIEMKTTFMRPGLERLVATGRLLHRTTSLAFCEATAVDGAGKLAAQATGTFKYVRALPVAGRRIERLNASD